jgi:hypothetical protein
MYHDRNDIYFRAILSRYGGAHAHFSLQVDIGGTWTDVIAEYEYTTNELYAQQVTLPGGMTDGQFYQYRLNIWGDGTGQAIAFPLGFCELPDAPPVGWAGMTPFTAITSAAAELNALKTNIAALQGFIGKSNALQINHVDYQSGSADYHFLGTMLYRPDNILVGVRAEAPTYATWYWTLSTASESAATSSAPYEPTWTLRYTSATFTGRSIPDQQRWDYKPETIPTTAWGFSAGDRLLWRITVYNATTVCHAMCAYASRAVVETGWQSLRQWAYGDTAVGPTNLNAFQTNLTILYTFNTGALQVATNVACPVGAAWTAAPAGAQDPVEMKPHPHSGVYRYRYLYYHVFSERQRPILRYGPNSDTEIGLSTGLVTGELFPHWFMVDLGKLDPKLIPGNVYFIENCVAAIEMSEELAAYA